MTRPAALLLFFFLLAPLPATAQDAEGPGFWATTNAWMSGCYVGCWAGNTGRDVADFMGWTEDGRANAREYNDYQIQQFYERGGRFATAEELEARTSVIRKTCETTMTIARWLLNISYIFGAVAFAQISIKASLLGRFEWAQLNSVVGALFIVGNTELVMALMTGGPFTAATHCATSSAATNRATRIHADAPVFGPTTAAPAAPHVFGN